MRLAEVQSSPQLQTVSADWEVDVMRFLKVLGLVGATSVGLVMSGCSGEAGFVDTSEHPGLDGTHTAHAPEGGTSGVDSANSPIAAESGDWYMDGGEQLGGTDGYWGDEDPNDESIPSAGDSYHNVGTNPFTIASSDPQSTFAADVDTASYDIFRRDLNVYNTLPQPASVRLEEYVNFFDYDYAAPEGDAPFSISLDAAPNPFVIGTTLVRVGIQGTRLSQLPRKDANIVFLVDASGSMGGQGKMELVKQTLMEAVDVFNPTDSVSIVTYAGGAGVLLPPTPASEKAVIKGAINSLQTGGSTAGASGINAAYAQAEDGFIDGGINHVIMCTDGDFNVGLSSDQNLVELIEERRASGVTFTALGFGAGNLNDSMMEKVTNAGNGTYSVIIDDDSAVDYAQNKLLQAMYFIAKDMKLQVTFNPDTVHAYRLLGYEINDIPDELFADDTIDAGEVGAGHNVTALYEVVMHGGDIPLPDGAPEPEDSGELFDGELNVMAGELVRVAVRWKDVDAGETTAASEVSQGILEAAVLDDFAAATDDFKWATAIAAFAEILKGSPYSSMDNLESIGSIVAGDSKSTWAREEFAELFTQAIEIAAANNLLPVQ